jgi:ubiquinone/menaquinone biosynthesis C-methylase UbiE
LASPRLGRVRRIYDRDPKRYDASMSSGLMAWVLRGRREKVGEMMRGRALDVGFGTGLSLPHYPPGVEVVGVDASPRMLAIARSAARRAGRRIEVLVMDAEALAFPDRSFDSVAFNLCLCTIPDPERAVREGVRVARPGARMVFLEHVRSNVLPLALVQDALNPLLVALQEDHFTRRPLDVVRRAGVEVESVDRWLGGMFNLIVGRSPAC